MYRSRQTGRLLYLALPLLLLFLGACASKLVPTFSHQGRLLGADGNPVPDGDYTIDYGIYYTASGGTAAYTESKTVAVQDGLFTTSLGLTSQITPTIFAQPTWLQVSINGEALTPRQQLQGAPYAFSLASGSAVQGTETLDRTFGGQEKTGAALVVLNNDGTATGGHGLLALNRAAAAGDARADVAAFQARALGGVVPDATGSYGAIITSQAYRGMYVTANDIYYAAVFDSPAGIAVIGGNCDGCTMAYYAQNVGDAPIHAGDFVAVEGVTLDADLNIPVMQVRRATGPDDTIIGVAAGAATRAPVGESNGVRTGGFDAAAGPAAAGGYLSVAVQGLVRATAADPALQAGASLTAGPDGAVGAPAGGGYTRALSAVDDDGMVWVMLSGQ
jgi:hypothetical protein